jgi:hypothetical protein
LVKLDPFSSVCCALIAQPDHFQVALPRGTGIVHAPPAVHTLSLAGIHLKYIVAMNARCISPIEADTTRDYRWRYRWAPWLSSPFEASLLHMDIRCRVQEQSRQENYTMLRRYG